MFLAVGKYSFRGSVNVLIAIDVQELIFNAHGDSIYGFIEFYFELSLISLIVISGIFLDQKNMFLS